MAVLACAALLSGSPRSGRRCTARRHRRRRRPRSRTAPPHAHSRIPRGRAWPSTCALSDDLHTVTGTETVRFTPDRPLSQLVFRLVPNDPGSATAGNRLTVDHVRGSDVAGGSHDTAGAGDPGGLYRVRLRPQLDGGRTTTVTLAWTLRLGRGAFDRVGTDQGPAGGVAW